VLNISNVVRLPDARKRQARRKRLKLERDRERKRQKRRAAGAMLRANYEAQSLSKLKPWEAEGVSRRTWYRQRREMAQVRRPAEANSASIFGNVRFQILQCLGSRTARAVSGLV
jgi:hypothetical protein